MEIRPTTDDDVVAAPWPLHPDGWRAHAHARVQVRGDRVVGAVARVPDPVHPTRDAAWLHLSEDADPVALLDAVCWLGPRPMSFTAELGTAEHRALIAAGAMAYQHLPAQLVATGTPEVSTWCERHQLLEIEDLTRYDDDVVADLWSTFYEILHAPWAPCAEHEVLLAEFRPLAPATDRHLSGFVADHGVPVAAALCIATEETTDACVEALVPDHAWAREAVASLMSRVLRGSDRPVRFDGHVSDPHFYPLLQTLPDVRAGGGYPAEMLEF